MSETPMTDYMVFATWDHAHDGPEPGKPPSTWPTELWREAGVVSVPQRTNRSTVVEHAKQLVACMMRDIDTAVSIRVMPVNDVTTAQLKMVVREPELTATIVGREPEVHPGQGTLTGVDPD